jgi:hypothetical protein
MAPELMADDKRAVEYDGDMIDVYAFGITMWVVFARQRPYASTRTANVWALRERILGGERPEIESNVALLEAPANAIRLMEQCWEKDPERRPSGFDEVQQRLERRRIFLSSSVETDKRADELKASGGPDEPSAGGGKGARNKSGEQKDKGSFVNPMHGLSAQPWTVEQGELEFSGTNPMASIAMHGALSRLGLKQEKEKDMCL